MSLVANAAVTGTCGPECASLCTSAGLRAAYAAHAGELLRFSRRRLRDHVAAEDVVQEVFLRAWRNCRSYHPAAGSLRTWLFAITRNAVVDAVRATRRRAWHPVDGSELLNLAAPGDDFACAAERELVVAAIDGLSTEHRAVVVGFYLQQRTYDEMASAMNVPVGTVKSRLYYAVRALRQALAEPGPRLLLA